MPLWDFSEEFQAGSTIEALRAKLALKARVMRDGGWLNIAASQLVPGDRVRLRRGEIIPADVILVSEGSVQIDQSTLTGESLPVEKKAGRRPMQGRL